MKPSTFKVFIFLLAVGIVQIIGCESLGRQVGTQPTSAPADPPVRPHTYTWPPGRPLPAGVELRIEPEKEVIRTGDASVIRAVVGYHGAGQLRFREIGPERNFEVIVTDEEGHAVPLTRFGQQMVEWKRTGMPMTNTGDIPLDGGESVAERVVVSRQFDLTLPGKYTIFMERDVRSIQDQFMTVNGGRIRSNTIVIEVQRPLPESLDRSTSRPAK